MGLVCFVHSRWSMNAWESKGRVFLDTYIYNKSQLNVGKYTIHWSYRLLWNIKPLCFFFCSATFPQIACNKKVHLCRIALLMFCLAFIWKLAELNEKKNMWDYSDWMGIGSINTQKNKKNSFWNDVRWSNGHDLVWTWYKYDMIRICTAYDTV